MKGSDQVSLPFFFRLLLQCDPMTSRARCAVCSRLLMDGSCPVHGAAPTAPAQAPAFWEEDEAPVAEPTREIADSLPTPGSKLGDYVLGEPLGQGGQAMVFEARDASGRPCALKVLTDVVELETLKSEARLSLRVQHRNVLRVERFVERPRPFLVMERVRGESLELSLGSGVMSWSAFAPIFSQAIEALDAIHSAGLIHRDVKPSNLLLAADGRVVLIDFGTARDRAGAALVAPTRTGTVRGTLEFMSPEQLRGEALDARTDLFSLGCVAWLALTGEFPWPGKGTATARARMQSDAAPLRVKGVPTRVARLLEQLVARDRNARPASASACRVA